MQGHHVLGRETTTGKVDKIDETQGQQWGDRSEARQEVDDAMPGWMRG